MIRLSSVIASKVRSAKNSVQPVVIKLNWSRSYAAKDIKFRQCNKYKTVLSKAISTEGCKALAAGVNAKDLRDGIEMAIGVVSKNISSRARVVRTSEEIAQVATISANGDREIGMLVAKAAENVGKENIIITDVKTPCTKLEFFLGMKLNHGYVSSSLTTTRDETLCVLEPASIFIYENKLSDFDILYDILSVAERKPVLIVAEDFENDFLESLIVQKSSAGFKVCAIKAPEFGETRKAYMRELASRTDGMVISEKDFDYSYLIYVWRSHHFPSMLGNCEKVIVSESDTIILERSLSMEQFEEASSEQLRSAHKGIRGEDSLFAVMKVGGGKKKSMVTRALNVVMSAMEGVLPGCGMAFLYASKELDKLQTTNCGQKIGVQIIQKALKMPVRTYASAAGFGVSVVDKLLEQDNPELGYNADKGEYVDLIKCGIVDPLNATRREFMEASSMFLKDLRKREKIKKKRQSRSSNEDEKEILVKPDKCIEWENGGGL